MRETASIIITEKDKEFTAESSTIRYLVTWFGRECKPEYFRVKKYISKNLSALYFVKVAEKEDLINIIQIPSSLTDEEVDNLIRQTIREYYNHQ